VSAYPIRCTFNGIEQAIEIDPDQRAIDLLRDTLHMTGVKEGCGIGVCGLCTVLVDGEPLSSCLLLAVFLDGTDVVTIEGLAGTKGELTALQEAFITEGGFQCGICTPGQLLAATALLAVNRRPTREQAKEWMMGNLCRCTGYAGILDAIMVAAEAGDA